VRLPVAPDVAIADEYAVPTCPLGSVEVVMTNGVDVLIVTVNPREACCDAESCAVTVNVYVAAVVGVPASTHVVPDGVRLNPGGSDPEVATQEVTLPVAPDVAMADEYVTPTCPLGRVVVVMTNGVDVLIVTVNPREACWAAESCAVTVKVYVAAVVGVPASTQVAPEGARPRPAGKVPEVAAQEVTLPTAPDVAMGDE
jgi:hypothetical protein